MKSLLIASLLFFAAGCASAPAACRKSDGGSSESVLADAKLRSAQYCGEIPDGCELSISERADGWTVDAWRNVRSGDGSIAHSIGGNRVYDYDCSGRFQEESQGY